MIAYVDMLGYNGLVKILNTNANGYDIEFLEGNLEGKKSYLSKNSKNENIKLIKKASGKIERKGRIKENNHYKNNWIYYDITIKSSLDDISERICDIIIEKIMSNIKEFSFVGCPTKENNCYSDSLAIEINTIEDTNIKELFKKIKKDLFIR